MKPIQSLLIGALMAVSLAACSKSGDSGNSSNGGSA